MENSTLPLVSVLVPLYNHEHYIEECLDSIINDEYQNKELLVLDDGSTDNSAEVVRQWYVRNNNYFAGRFEFISRENRGISKTLNELIAKAAGDFIAFVSSDDFLLPGGVLKRLEYLLSHPDKMVVVSDYKVVDEHSKVTHQSGVEELFDGRRRYLANQKLLAREIVFHWSLAGPVYLSRRRFYEEFGGYNEALLVEDWDLCLRLVAADALGFVDFPCAAYRLHSSNVSRDPQSFARLDESIIKTVDNNIERFSGLEKLFLLGTRMKFIGGNTRRLKKGSVKGFILRKAGKFLMNWTKRLYDLVAPTMHRMG